MKAKLTLFLLACLTVSSGIFAQTVWDDFDNPENVVYTYFDGTAFDQNFTNPSTGGANTSAICARYVRNNAVEYDVIVIDPSGTNVVDDVSGYVAGTQKMSVKVFSPAPGMTVQITLEDKNSAGPTNYPTGRHSEYNVTTTASNAWETLEFNFVQQPDPTVSDTSVNRLVLLFEPGTFNSTVWLWDDLMGPEFVDPCAGVTPDMTIVDDYECQRHLSYDFTNGNLGTIENPLTTGINSSMTCAKFTKFPPPTNDGAFGGALEFAFNTSTYNKASIQLYSPASPQDFHVIFQDNGSQTVADTIFTTTSSSAWVNYDMDLSGVSSAVNITNVVLLLDPSTATEDTIYLDNFTLSFDSVLTSRAQEEEEIAISLYPQPFGAVLNIGADQPIAVIECRDLTGRLVTTVVPDQDRNIVISTETWSPGLYLIRITGQNGKSVVRKVIHH